MIIHKAVHKQSLEWGIMRWYHYRRQRFAVTTSRVRRSITEPFRELHGHGCSHTTGAAIHPLPFTLQMSQLLFLPFQLFLLVKTAVHGLKMTKISCRPRKMARFTGTYTQILPAETAMEDILAFPDPQQSFRIDLAALRTALRE